LTTRNRSLSFGYIAIVFAVLSLFALSACGGGEQQSNVAPPNMKVIKGCISEGDKPGCYKIVDEQDKQTYSFKHPGAKAGIYAELVTAAPHAGDCDDKNQIGVTTITVIKDQCATK
jgi:hypothetical protein